MRQCVFVWLSAVALFLVSGGCQSELEGHPPPHLTQQDDPTTVEGDDTGPDVQDPDGSTNPDPSPPDGHLDPYEPDVCSRMEAAAEVVSPNLLLMVDRSGSMQDATSTTDARAKLEVAKTALEELVDSGRERIHFCLMEFPDAAGLCSEGALRVPCGPDSHLSIELRVRHLVAGGGTPTGGSLEAARQIDALKDPVRASFVILLTDGMPTCPNGQGDVENEADNALAIQAIEHLRTDGIDTFVVGLGGAINDSANTDVLNAMAEAGGRARADPDVRYYPANALSELQTIFDAISTDVTSCAFSLDEEPWNADEIWVYLDDVEVPRDPNHLDGFDYDSDRQQVEIYGPRCEAIRTGEAANVRVELGCPPV